MQAADTRWGIPRQHVHPGSNLEAPIRAFLQGSVCSGPPPRDASTCHRRPAVLRKSTLAGKIVEANGFQCIAVDDFFQRYEEFLTAIGQLAGSGHCSYYPFDWPSMKVSQELRTVMLADGPVIVEGTSSLPWLAR